MLSSFAQHRFWQRLSLILHPVMLLALMLVLLAACGLPRSAPLQSEILRQKKGEVSDFAVYPVTKLELPRIASWNSVGYRPRAWVPHSHGHRQVIQPGDTVDLVIWDSEANSLLTTPDQKSANLQGIVVGPDGAIFMPYLDKIRIAGQSPDGARRVIQRKMEDIIPSAQVQLSVTPGARQKVDVVGGVSSPGSYPLLDPDGHSSVLGMLSLAGGVSSDLRNPQVSLTRSGRVYQIALSQLYQNPKLDTVVRGRDKIIVAQDDRYFRSLGAASKVAIVPFDQEKISALDAMSMIEGISQSRADPKGILVLREYPAAVVRSGGPSHERTIFTVDLTTADGLFSADRFLIHPGDTVMVTEAPIAAASTVIGLFTDVLRISNAVQ